METSHFHPWTYVDRSNYKPRLTRITKVVAQLDGSFVASTGDKGGWLQTYTTDKRGYPYGGSKELYLGSEVLYQRFISF